MVSPLFTNLEPGNFVRNRQNVNMIVKTKSYWHLCICFVQVKTDKWSLNPIKYAYNLYSNFIVCYNLSDLNINFMIVNLIVDNGMRCTYILTVHASLTIINFKVSICFHVIYMPRFLVFLGVFSILTSYVNLKNLLDANYGGREFLFKYMEMQIDNNFKYS